MLIPHTSKWRIRRKSLLVFVLGTLLTLLLPPPKKKIAKDEKVATEDFENPAFNISSTDISTHQTYKVGLIRHDKLTSSLEAQPQKFRLQAQAEPRGEISLLITISLSDNGYVLDLTCPFHVDSNIVSRLFFPI